MTSYAVIGDDAVQPLLHPQAPEMRPSGPAGLVGHCRCVAERSGHVQVSEDGLENEGEGH